MFKPLSPLFPKLAAAALAIAASMAPALAPSALARDQVPAETREKPWSAVLPGCADNMVLYTVSNRFGETESTYWRSALKIEAYEQIQTIADRPYGLDYIPRRYCSATALMSDGVKRKVYYSIAEGLGTPGPAIFNVGYEPWGVEFCVTGLDRSMAYAPGCKMARP